VTCPGSREFLLIYCGKVRVKNTWLFPFIESLHLAGLAMFVGTAALSKSGRILRRWTHSGLLLLLITGLAMFFADTPRYLANPAFRVKMALFPVAILCQLSPLRRGRAGWFICVLLWTLVALASRAIADFDIANL